MLVLLGVRMASCLMSYAQTQAYADYPRTRGGVEHWKQEDFPSWLSLDGQSRLRTEDDYFPATYVIDTAGIIRFAHVDVDYMLGRAEPEVVVAVLETIAPPIAR